MKRILLFLSALAFAPFAFAGEVKVAWDASTPTDKVAGYEVLYGTTKGGPYVIKLDVGNVLLRTISGLSAGLTYYSVVRAYTEGKTVFSGNSNELEIAMPAAVQLLAPGNYRFPEGSVLTVPPK